MRTTRLLRLIGVCAATCTVIWAAFLPGIARAQDQPEAAKWQFPPNYNPYPPGILPSDLSSEIARVQREITTIEQEAIGQWHALKPPTLAGNPPTLQGTGIAAVEILGKLMNFDLNISPFRNEACASCHMPYAAFSGPIPSVNLTMIAYPGTAHFRAGKRTAQRYTYAAYFPALQYNATQGLFFGGNFWDSRATGYLLRNADSEQAQHPPVDTQEMGFPDTACIAFRLSQAKYLPLFETVFGAGSFDIKFPSHAERICSTPGGAAVFGGSATPLQDEMSPEDRKLALSVYNNWGEALDAFEHSLSVSPFTSKFDAYLASQAAGTNTVTLTADELAGYELFNGKGNCNSCHVDGRGTTLTAANSPDNSKTATVNPLFTCFGSANEGLPLNPRVALFYQNKPDPFGFTPNPLGFGYRDLGLGTFLRSGFGSAPNPNASWIPQAPSVDGQQQVMTARNVAMTPPQCPTTEAGRSDSSGKPVPYFQKEFFHNGYIKSLKQLVHFYNTRDVYPYPVTSGHCPAGTTERVDCWPMPEVAGTVDMTTGKLGLTDKEEDQIVAFLETLTDGFTTPYPDENTFTGACKTGGSSKTQGNESLIPTPPLPPCSPEICGVPPLPSQLIP
jgi:cytochrome c peroxidase